MSKKINKIIMLFLLLGPFIDIVTSFQVKNNLSLTIGTILRGLFFVFVIIYLYKNKISKKLVTLFIIYFILAISYYFLYTKNNILSEIVNIIKIFYLPFLIHFFNNYNNEKINDKLIVIIYLFYLNLVIIPFIFGIGNNLSDVYKEKHGYFGLFYGGNELSAILLGLLPIVFNYLIKSKNYLLKIFIFLEIVICTILIGTKTLFLGIILVLIYFYIIYLKNKSVKRKSKFIMTFIIILFASLTIIISPKLNVVKNMKVTLDYYNVKKVNDFSFKKVDEVIFSKRLSNLGNVNKAYVKSDFKAKLYGLGIDKINRLKDVEIDIFDLFYSVGIFGFIIYIFIIYQKQKLKSYYKFSLILFILMSISSGHILLEPMVSIYIALLCILNKNCKEEQKTKILLVSNMYPNEKYKHFGSFVKNVNDLLIENGFDVDKVVKYKETTFFGKLYSYISFYTKTILKGIFNNYDYIYVHYISHSSLGAIIPKITSKDTKLVLNAHGNDVVKDYDFEEKNIRKSTKFLKYADHVVVPSNYFKNVMIEKYNIEEKNITVYPSGGVNTTLFKNKDKEESKKNCNLDKDSSYIGYVSRIEKNKGYDIFLRAIKELEKEDKIGNKKFLIVGAGDEEPLMNELIKELDILKYLEIRNLVSQKELVDIYNSLDIFVFPTYRESESLGLVGLEAMACEKVVIASNNYGPTDYVINKKNGLFFKPKDYKDLKDKIIEAENLNNEQKNKITKKARETAIKYDLENTKEIILKVFKSEEL